MTEDEPRALNTNAIRQRHAEATAALPRLLRAFAAPTQAYVEDVGALLAERDRLRARLADAERERDNLDTALRAINTYANPDEWKDALQGYVYIQREITSALADAPKPRDEELIQLRTSLADAEARATQLAEALESIVQIEDNDARLSDVWRIAVDALSVSRATPGDAEPTP
jgi:chromosome segregation ATPase